MTTPHLNPPYGSYYYFLGEIADAMGLERNTVVLDSTLAAKVQNVLNAGLFQVYFPPPLPVPDGKPSKGSHVWSFLFPSATLSLVASTGTYELPIDFAGNLKDFTCSENNTWRIPIVSMEALRQALNKGDLSDLDTEVFEVGGSRTVQAANDDPTGIPVAAAIEAKAANSGRQAYQVLFYPTPHRALTLTYRYQVQPQPLSDTNIWPLGTTVHTETILASCMCILASRGINKNPNAQSYFLERLTASIAQDVASGATSGGLFPILHTNKSDLGIDYFYLQRHVGEFLGFDWNPDSWGHAEQHEVDEVIESGYRRYLYPDPVDAARSGHQWSFLSPVGKITTADGQRVYPLPPDFEHFVGSLSFDENQTNEYGEIQVTSDARLRALAHESDVQSIPCYAATRVAPSDGLAGQRQELILHPTPDGTYQISFQYHATQRKLSKGFPVPLGGPVHAEGIYASCMAVAEERKGVKNGVHFQAYQRRLVAAIVMDSRRAPQNLGYNGDASIYSQRETVAPLMTYNGVDYDGS